MNVFLLDLWHDLREKRLAPVAVLLALALAAVPFVLRKSTEPAPVAPVATGSPSEDAQKSLAVKALQQSELPSSDLGVFDPRNPFKPLGRPEEVTDTGKAGVPASDEAATPGATGGGGDTTSSAAGSGGPSGGGGGGASGGGGGGGGGGSDSAPAPAPRNRNPQKLYSYVVDIEFGKVGEERSRKGVKRLSLLPSKENPLLVFLGVKTDGKRAVFLTDSSLSQAGEGRCSPDRDTCTFLELQDVSSRNEHSFTDETGQRWRIVLVDIRRVEVKPAKNAAESSTRPKARVEQESSRPSSIFESLLFADESR